MVENKYIISHCPNFFQICNYEIDDDDVISIRLVDLYKQYIFSIDYNDKKEIEKIERLDYVLNKYLSDYLFRKHFKSEVANIKVSREGNILQNLIDKIIDAFECYEVGYTRNIYFARWI